MELIFPTMVGIVFAAIVVMFLLPRLSPVVLGVVALVFLVLAARQHYTFFYTEYQQSTWQESIASYSPFLLLGGLVLFLLFFIINFIGTSSTAANAPVANMNTALNKVVNQAPSLEQGMTNIKNTVTNAVTNVVNTVKNTVGLGPPPRANNGQGQGQGQVPRFSQV